MSTKPNSRHLKTSAMLILSTLVTLFILPLKLNAGFSCKSALQMPSILPIRTYEDSTRFQEFYTDKFYPNINANRRTLVVQVSVPAGAEVKNRHNIEMFIPLGSGLEEMKGRFINTLLYLPTNHIENLNTIRFNPEPNKHDYELKKYYGSKFSFSLASTDLRFPNTIDVFSYALNDFSNTSALGLHTLRHEFGHLLATKLFKSQYPDSTYVNLAQKDQYGVSEYGNTNWAEDFAEALVVYLRSNAGIYEPQIRDLLAHRFHFFDHIFKNRTPQSSSGNIFKLNKNGNEIFVVPITQNAILVLSLSLQKGVLITL